MQNKQKHFLITLLWLFLLAATCCYADALTLDSGRCAKEEINDVELLVISPDDHSEPVWFMISNGRIQALKNPPPTMHEVITLKASDDNKYLAILSVGEGHPVIDIVALGDVLHDKKARCYYSLDPYPGTVDIVAWKANALHIKSDMPLTHMNKGARVPDAPTFFSYESFLLDVESKTIKPLKK